MTVDDPDQFGDPAKISQRERDTIERMAKKFGRSTIYVKSSVASSKAKAAAIIASDPSEVTRGRSVGIESDQGTGTGYCPIFFRLPGHCKTNVPYQTIELEEELALVGQLSDAELMRTAMGSLQTDVTRPEGWRVGLAISSGRHCVGYRTDGICHRLA